MQTFLPYKSFIQSAKCLDNKRLGKQRVEAMQILNALETGSSSRWRNHPAVKMWRGHEDALKSYHDSMIHEWVERGFTNNMQIMCSTADKYYLGIWSKPSWITPEFCRAHRSNLLRKDPIYYSQFNWNVPDGLPYIWPVS